MMNLDHVPPIPAMNTAAVQFLDLLADPKAARKLMDDIVTSHARASAAHAEAVKVRGEVSAAQAKVDGDKKDFEQHRAAHSAFLKQSAAELDERHGKADERERELRQLERDLDARASDLDAREAAVSARESRASSAERELANAQAAHGARAELIRRVSEHFDAGVALWNR